MLCPCFQSSPPNSFVVVVVTLLISSADTAATYGIILLFLATLPFCKFGQEPSATHAGCRPQMDPSA